MNRYVKTVIAISLLGMVVTGSVWYATYKGRLVKVGDVAIDPIVPLDPEREYRLVLWDHHVPLPWDVGAHDHALASAIAEFEKVYPNIRVELRILPWDEGHGRLKEALLQGTPPDVYGMPLGVRLMDPAFQVPVTPYMSLESRQDHLDRAVEAISVDNTVWAWPRWVLPRVWLTHKAFVSSVGGVAPTFEQFIDAATKDREQKGTWALAANPFDPTLFTDVMIASTGRSFINDQGLRAWTADEMEEALSFFAALLERRLMDHDPQRMGRRRLMHFWRDEAQVIAPVNPWLLRHILLRSEGVVDERQPVLLSPPTPRTDRSGHPALLSGYAVFRQEAYQGDDHTKAAMLLAEHLARRLGPWEASHLFAVPAHPTAWQHWREEIGLPDDEVDRLIAWAQLATASPLVDAHAQMQGAAVERIIGAELPRLWDGASPAEIAQSIARRVDGLQSHFPAPTPLPPRRPQD